MNKWRSVAEEPPKIGTDVFTWTDNTDGCGGFAVARLCADGSWIVTGNAVSDCGADVVCFYTPSHWTELPPEPSNG